MRFGLKSSILLALAGLSCISCVSIGRHRVQTPTAAKLDAAENRVVIVLLDKVNHDAFEIYLSQLREQDYEPRHLSGISLLARNQFKLANAAYGQSSIPATTATTEATIFTGQAPIDHGVTSPRYDIFGASNPKMHVDLTTPEAQSRFFLGPDWSEARPNAPNLGRSLLGAAPWVKQLHQQRPTTTIFTAFGNGSDWHLPLINEPLSAALFAQRISKQTAQVIDQNVEEVVQERLAIGASVTIFRLLASRGYSCVVPKPGCQDESKSLASRQLEALKEIDVRLWRLFRNYQMSMPEVFERTTFIISGTSGVVERPIETVGNAAYEIDLEKVRESLSTTDNPLCSNLVSNAAKENQFSVNAFSGFMFVQIKPFPTGQGDKGESLRACLSRGFEEHIKPLMDIGKLDAATWRSSASSESKVHFNSKFIKENGALARRRITRKLNSLLQTRSHGSIVAAGFLRSPFVFSTESKMRLHEGGLSVTSLRFPLLFADKRLTQSARRQLEGASLDQIDFGPTVLGLVGLSKEARSSFDRTPLLAFQNSEETDSSVLRFLRSARDTYGAIQKSSPFRYDETDDSITVAYHEDRTIWPPEQLHFTFGPNKAEWSNTTETFDLSDCTFTNDGNGRTWQCILPKPSKVSDIPLVMERRPARNGDTVEQHSQAFHLRANAPNISHARLACASDEVVMLETALEVSDGLGSFTLQEESLESPQPLSHFEAVELSTKQLAQLCQAGAPSSMTCKSQAPKGLISLTGAVELANFYPRIDPPSHLHICARSGLCRSVPIDPLPESSECFY